MKHILLSALLLSPVALIAEDGAAPAPAPAAEAPKLSKKDAEAKMKMIREAAVKEDAELGKLKTDADAARKAYDTAVDAKLAGNADYQAAKKAYDEAKAAERKQKEGEKK